MMMRTLGSLVCLLVLAAGCRTRPTDQAAPPVPLQPLAVQPAPAPERDPAQVARGAYVAAVAGCNACHGYGGAEVTMPSGATWRAPNITPDRATGIGNWTDTQVITAMRRGIANDGTKLIPIMPYTFYHRMTDADAKAVVAFLRSQPPLYNAVEASDKMAIAPIDLPEPVNNVDDVMDPVAHGEYLATLMHCGSCHTPTEGAMANVTFAGGVVMPLETGGTVRSANVTSDKLTGIGTWSEQQIIAAIRTGKTPTGHVIEGPMAMYLEGWSMLDDRDAHALARYVQTIKPAHHDIPERHVTPVTSRR